MRVLIPAIDDAVAQYGKVALLMVLGEDFDGYTFGAAVDDARLGFRHISSFRRIALVTDNEWLRKGLDHAASLVPVMAAPLRITHSCRQIRLARVVV